MSELDIDAVVRTAVSHVRRNVYAGASSDDLYQEGWAWILSNPSSMEKYHAMKNTANAAFFLHRDLVRALRKVCNREKATQEGYELEDVYTYSVKAIELRGLIAECLRAIVTGVREPARVQTEVRSTVDPAEASNNFLVSMLDIEHGWRQLGPEDQKLLASFFVYEIPVSKLAEEQGVTDQHMYRHMKGALRRLVGPLNGFAAE